MHTDYWWENHFDNCPFERPRSRQENNIKVDIQETGIEEYDRSMKLDIHLHLVLSLRICGAITPLPHTCSEHGA
jgi:hypothetical protein